jgi:hypothetical protein
VSSVDSLVPGNQVLWYFSTPKTSTHLSMYWNPPKIRFWELHGQHGDAISGKNWVQTV